MRKIRKLTEEHKEKIRKAHTGLKWGKHSELTKNKMSLSANGKHNKEKCYFWKGGKSLEKYPDEYNNILKEKIRSRDYYICQECAVHQDELSGRFKKLDVHHIDYNKDNCNENNLITLCRSCHLKTNSNREYWFNYFNNS